MPENDAHNPDLLILTFPSGSSLSRWERYGVIDREIPFYRGIGRVVPRFLFVSVAGTDERRIARSLADRLGMQISAISEEEPDPALGLNRTIEERVLAAAGDARRIVIQTMQLEDGGLANRLISPLRRSGASAAIVARGSFIDSRVLASTLGPNHFSTLRAGESEHRLCAAAQIVVGTSDAMVDELAWKNGISHDRTRIINQHVFVSDLAVEREKGLIVTTGRLSGRCTALRTTIEAVGLLGKERKEGACLEIIADGPAGSDLPAFAESLGVRMRIRRGLTHAEMIASLARATVYVQAEDARRQSQTVLEAMSLGCPVVVSDLPEYNGIVINGSTGIRVVQEARAFSFAIDCLLGDKGFREMLGEAAHTQIAFRCSVDRVVADTLDCYRTALKMAPQIGESSSRQAS